MRGTLIAPPDPPDRPALSGEDILRAFLGYKRAAEARVGIPDHHGVVVAVQPLGETYEITVALDGGGEMALYTASEALAEVGQRVRYTPHAHRVIDGRARLADEERP